MAKQAKFIQRYQQYLSRMFGRAVTELEAAVKWSAYCAITFRANNKF